MSSLLVDLRFAFRSVKSARAATLAALLTLALGIGAATAIYSVVAGVLLRSLPFRDPERLVSLLRTDLKMRAQGSGVGTSPLWAYETWRTASAFEDMTPYSGGQPILTGMGDAERVRSWVVGSNFFSLLGVRPAIGRAFAIDEGRPGAPALAILGHGFWTTRFGGEMSAIGRTLTLDGAAYQIVGIMPPEMRFPEKVQLWTNAGFALSGSQGQQRAQDNVWWIAGRLRPGATLEQARAATDAASRAIWESRPKNAGMVADLQPLHDSLVGSVRTPLLALLGAVAFVLLVACANVANLMLARAVARGRELALRRAIGASGARVVRQMLTESLLLALAGGALGVLLAWRGVPALVALGARELPRSGEIGIDLRVLAVALVATIVTGVVFGIVPAFEALRHHPADAMREGGAAIGGRRRNRLSGTLIVAQVALTMVLLAGASLLSWTFSRLTSLDAGFRPDKVLIAQFRLAASRYSGGEPILAFAQSLEERVRTIPDVTGVAVSTSAPLAVGAFGGITIPGRPPRERDPRVTFTAFSGDYLKVLGIPVKRGRALRGAGEQTDAILINETLARTFFTGEDPMGRQIGFRGATGTVVGVVGDTREMKLTSEPWPQILQPLEAGTASYLNLLVEVSCAPGAECDPSAVGPAVRGAIAALDPGVPVDHLMTLPAMMAESVTRQRFYAVVLLVFSAATLLMAAGGLYGTVSYAVVLRTRELGLRVALGARPRGVLWLVVRRGLVLTAVGLALGAAGALATTTVLSSLLFEGTPRDPLALGAAAMVLLVVAAAACAVPGYGATRVDPLVALRAE